MTMKTYNAPLSKEIIQIREDYSYMDKLPLEGWTWEFIRRSSLYRRQYELVKRFVVEHTNRTSIKPNMDQSRKILSDERLKDTIQLNNIFSDFPKCIFRFIYENTSEPINKDSYLVVGYPFDKKCYIPHPDMPYFALVKDLKNNIKGTRSIIFRDYEFFKARIADWTNEIDFIDAGNITELKSWFADTVLSVLWELSLNEPGETIYFGIPKTVKKKEALEELASIVNRFTKTPKTKQRDADKWKHYLTVYDLRAKRPTMSFPKISSLMQNAYPSVKMKKGIVVEGSDYFSVRNCNTFYRNALDLIEGDYQKYLLSSK